MSGCPSSSRTSPPTSQPEHPRGLCRRRARVLRFAWLDANHVAALAVRAHHVSAYVEALSRRYLLQLSAVVLDLHRVFLLKIGETEAGVGSH